MKSHPVSAKIFLNGLQEHVCIRHIERGASESRTHEGSSWTMTQYFVALHSTGIRDDVAIILNTKTRLIALLKILGNMLTNTMLL